MGGGDEGGDRRRWERKRDMGEGMGEGDGRRGWVNPPHLTKQMDSTSQILMQLPIYSCLHIRRHLTIYYFNNLNGLGDMHC